MGSVRPLTFAGIPPETGLHWPAPSPPLRAKCGGVHDLAVSVFTIPVHGDVEERRCWPLFLGRMWPSYETFWAKNIVPLTYRTSDQFDIRLRPRPDFVALGKNDEDMTIAQLHYTTFVHLSRVRDLLEGLLDRWQFAEAIVRLTGASDCADELLQRWSSPGNYDPWSEDAGRKARNAWRNAHGRPLQDIHDYRNRIVHGRVVPELILRQGGDTIYVYPAIGRVASYLDWREAFDAMADAARVAADFVPAQKIAVDAWKRTVNYVERQWSTHLLGVAPVRPKTS